MIANTINERHSVRSFDKRNVTDGDLRKIIEAGCMAPSSKNDQPWKVVIVRRPKLGDICDYLSAHLDEENNQSDCNTCRETFRIMSTAPVALFIFLDEKFDKSRFLAHVESIGAFIENMLLTAQDMGIGSLWCGDILSVSDEVVRYFGIKDLPISAVVFGYEDLKTVRKYHKPPEDIIIKGYDEWEL